MTTPTERTRALRQAWALLAELSRRPDIPDDLKRAANVVLRHFPDPQEVANEALSNEARGRGLTVSWEQAWLLPEP